MSELKNEAGQAIPNQTIIVNQAEIKKSNGAGIAGFVLALTTIFLGWVPGLGWVLWVLGLIFSFVGVFKQPRGLAIAGLVISLFGLIMLTVILSALASTAAFF
jgi:hypothetical protein